MLSYCLKEAIAFPIESHAICTSMSRIFVKEWYNDLQVLCQDKKKRVRGFDYELYMR